MHSALIEKLGSLPEDTVSLWYYYQLGRPGGGYEWGGWSGGVVGGYSCLTSSNL